MAGVPSLLVSTLDQLLADPLKRFRWNLSHDVPKGFKHIPRGQLENRDVPDTVDQLLSAYGKEGAVVVTLHTLKKIDQNDLAQGLEKDYRKRLSSGWAGPPDLLADPLKRFRWNLSHDVPKGFKHIPRSQLENRDVPDTVDQLLSAYGKKGAVVVTLHTLKKIDQNDLAQGLEKDYRKNTRTHSDTATGRWHRTTAALRSCTCVLRLTCGKPLSPCCHSEPLGPSSEADPPGPPPLTLDQDVPAEEVTQAASGLRGATHKLLPSSH
ncbi:hypothetical protein AAFF_G00199060 [Aldrovandia affinis]|uniref:Pyrin domain-containing protein n=1 Tax=Aldrovandia affinis TaxID=143900 RepID=A0AAD7RIH4_9TELE|nr:hypothetical protein AAFF_G00199060 [Aldrovandia affinis]